MWTCDSCGEPNADGADVCDVCDQPRPSPPEGAAARRRAPNQRAVARYVAPPPPAQPTPEPEPRPYEPHTDWVDPEPARPPSSRRQVWVVAVAAAFTVVLALTAVIVLPRLLRSDHGNAAATPTPPLSATASPWPVDTPEPTLTMTATGDTPTPTDTYDEPTPTPSDATGLVNVDPGVGDPRAADIAAMFDTYFAGINDKDYDAVATVLDPSGTINPNNARQMSSFANGTRSTHDSDIALVAISDLTGNRVLADVTFRSQQAAGDGPRGRTNETCTRWRIAYTISTSAAGYRIVRGKGSSQPC